MVLLCIALAYSLTIRILGDADQSTPVTLRGSSAVDEPDNTAAREAASAWEPEQQDRVSKFSYDNSRGPVKGGVEIYPVQVGASNEVCLVWQPSAYYKQELFVYHGYSECARTSNNYNLFHAKTRDLQGPSPSQARPSFINYNMLLYYI